MTRQVEQQFQETPPPEVQEAELVEEEEESDDDEGYDPREDFTWLREQAAAQNLTLAELKAELAELKSQRSPSKEKAGDPEGPTTESGVTVESQPAPATQKKKASKRRRVFLAFPKRGNKSA